MTDRNPAFTRKPRGYEWILVAAMAVTLCIAFAPFYALPQGAPRRGATKVRILSLAAQAYALDHDQKWFLGPKWEDRLRPYHGRDLGMVVSWASRRPFFRPPPVSLRITASRWLLGQTVANPDQIGFFLSRRLGPHAVGDQSDQFWVEDWTVLATVSGRARIVRRGQAATFSWRAER